MISATLTNAVSNGLHATFLFIYFFLALLHFIQKDRHFAVSVVLFFFVLWVLKAFGIYVHYTDQSGIPPAWIAVSLLTVLLNYLVVHAMKMPAAVRTGVVILSLGAVYLFLTSRTGEFRYIAAAMMLGSIICAYYAKGKVRLGFLMVVFSNILWISARFIANAIAGQDLPLIYRYDNDVYHVLLIISTFILYKGVTNGDWVYPEEKA